MEQLYQKFLASAGVSIDSRRLTDGQLFFALRGENFDGHDYVAAALDSGASHVIIDDADYQDGDRTIMVSDVLESLQLLAYHHRCQFDIPVIGLTGSNGKTTTKELLKAVLDKKFKVHCTRGNLNNHLGVPLTILEASKDSEIMIIEMGANHIGEIEALCKISMPNHGLITNIGYAHIEGFGSYNGVVAAKTELYRHLSDYGCHIFYNPEDKVLVDNLPQNASVTAYGRDIELGTRQGISLEFRITGDERFIQTKLFGSYNLANISAARTVGKYFGVADRDIITALTDYTPANNRSQIIEVGDVRLIMDAYNANPSSMLLSIESFIAMKTDRAKVLILGDMKELGDDAISMHRDILALVDASDWADVILVGPIFGQARMADQYSHYPSTEDLARDKAQLANRLKDKVVLLKASRSIGLEQIETLLS